MFYFFIVIKIPPLGDLYRRYLEINAYSDTTTLSSILSAHPDVLLYLHGWLFQLLHIPFFFIPAMYAGIMCYLYLASLRNLCLAHYAINPESQVTSQRITFAYLVVFSSLNIFNLVLGIRYGTAFVFVIYAITCYFSQRKLKCWCFLTLSLLMHFSMVFILAIFVVSRYVKIKKNHVIILSTVFFILSASALRWVLPKFTFMGIGDYALTGYVEGSWSAVPDDKNTLIVAILSRLLSFILFIFYLSSRSHVSGFDRFLNLLIPCCFLMSISYTAMGRYLNIAHALLVIRVCYLFLFPGGYTSKAFNSLLRGYLLVFMCISLMVINVYTQRRTLTMGGLWSYAYTSPIFLLNYNVNQFNKYLSEIDHDGYWIEHR